MEEVKYFTAQYDGVKSQPGFKPLPRSHKQKRLIPYFPSCICILLNTSSIFFPWWTWPLVISVGQYYFLSSWYLGQQSCNTCSALCSPNQDEHSGVGDMWILWKCLISWLFCSVLGWKLCSVPCGLQCDSRHLLDAKLMQQLGLFSFSQSMRPHCQVAYILLLLWQFCLPFHFKVHQNEMVPLQCFPTHILNGIYDYL